MRQTAYTIEERHRSLFEFASDAIFIIEIPTARILRVNERATELVLYTEEELQRMTVFDLDLPEDRPRVQAVIEQVLEGGSVLFEHRMLCKDGTVVPVEISTQRIEYKRGPALQSFVRDITERKKAEDALRESEQSFRLMFAHNPLPMWVYDRETHVFLDVNDAALEKYGYAREEFLSMKIEDIRPAEDIPRFREYIDAVSATVHQVTQWRHRKKDGTVLDVEVTAQDFPYRERPGRLVLANDITERKRLEKEILEISNREQRRIGQDLHDELGQLLTGIGFRLAELEGDLQTTEGPLAADAAEVGQMVERAIAQTRALARGLDPVNVEQQGLAVALREMTLSIEEIYGVSCVFVCPEPIQALDPEVATHAYRVAQEAIDNTLKHAQASRIDVRLVQQGTLLKLTVSDDGIGLPATNPRGEGMGLRIMDYRVRIIGGTFTVQPGADGGTLVTCLFPHTSVLQSADEAHATESLTRG